MVIQRKHRAKIYIRDPKENGNMTLIGHWNGSDLSCRTTSMFPRSRLSNLSGKSLRASSFEFRPYTYVVDTVDGVTLYDGVEVTNLKKTENGYGFI